ncbi:MAG: RidA family protein [Parvularculaceae bacterium]
MRATFINPPTLSKPTGYSHVAIAAWGRQVHLSGQVAFASDGQLVGDGDLAAQAEQVYLNIKAGLAAAGADISHVFKVVTYVVDLDADKAAAVRTVRLRHFGDGPYPASTMVGISALVDPRLLIEIEAIAALD